MVAAGLGCGWQLPTTFGGWVAVMLAFMVGEGGWVY